MQTSIALPDLKKLDPDTRSRIEAAVLDIFSEREFHRIGLIEIARGANVSLQTIYKYYGSKEALLFSGLDSWLGQLVTQMGPYLQANGLDNADMKQRLRSLFDVALNFFERNPKVMQIVMSSVYLNTWRRSAGSQNREFYTAITRMLAQGQAQGVLNRQVSEEVLLDYCIGIIVRLVQGYISRGMNEPLTPQADTLFEMLWQAIAARH
ncbi:TetR/AcrR family transcriptional regulator [Hydrocarboniphaga sp.]|uniref:TetR/AcrR family transcriptional regulator n=1 Tax=Hydrocarboniphaga sp. TaxID=2033016 RepID=UPI003D1424EC